MSLPRWAEMRGLPDLRRRLRLLSIFEGNCAPVQPPRPPAPGGGSNTCEEVCSKNSICVDTSTGPPPSCGSCKQVGGGWTADDGFACILCECCDPVGDCPPDPCDCNCDNDCADCEICNAAGKCEPDPACEDRYKAVYWYSVSGQTYACKKQDCSWGTSTPGAVSVRRTWVGAAGAEDPGPWAVVPGSEGPGYLNSCGRSCGFPTFSQAKWDPGSDYRGAPTQVPATYYGSIGFNKMRVVYLTLGRAVGYGNTVDEAKADARSKLP